MNSAPTQFAQRLKIAAAILAIVAVLWFVYTVRGILAPFALAFVLAYVLTPLIDRMEGRGINRTGSILLIFVGVFTLLILGLITAGKKLADEMVDLSVEFLRQESVDAELVLTNTTDKRVWLNGYWWQSQGDPFSLVDAQFPVEVGAGQELLLRLRFAPSSAQSAIGNLRLTRSDTTGFRALALRGNTFAIESEPGSASVPLDIATGPSDWDGIAFSAGGIDFGNAGPNVITRLSSLARGLEPLAQSWLGPEFEIEFFIREYGSSLITVLLGEDTDLVGSTKDLLGGIFSGIVLLVIVPFVAFFFLREGRRITHGLIELVPNKYFELCLNLIHQINGQIGAYIRGQLLAVSVVATLAVSGLTLIGVPYALPVGVLAGLANMIPYLGPLIGIAVATVVAIATLGGFSMVWQVVVVFLIIQLIDNILIQPIVVAKSVDLHPLVVLVVVMIGSDLGQIPGMLVAVPVTGIVKVSVETVYEAIKGYRTT